MASRGPWTVAALLVGVLLLLAGPGRSAAAEFPQTAERHTVSIAAPRGHAIRRMHHRHRPVWIASRHHAPAQAVVPAIEEPLTVDACRDVLGPCTDVQASEALLVRETRRAIYEGVPAPRLRVGFDDWLDRLQQDRARSESAAVDVVRTRIAFVRNLVDQHREAPAALGAEADAGVVGV